MTVFISSKLINICGNEKYWNLLESPPTPSTYPHWTVWNHKRVEIFSEAAFIFLCACVFTRSCFNFPITGKSFSEQLIIASVNPQYDNRLFIELQVQYEKNISLEHVAYKNCFECQNKNKKQFLYPTSSELVFFSYWSRISMNNLSSYCELTDSRMSSSDTDLPVWFKNNLVRMKNEGAYKLNDSSERISNHGLNLR